MVTLPSSWIKKHNVEKGDYVDLLLKDNTLIISLDKEISPEKILVDISGFDNTLAWRYFCACYASGYDNINIKYDNDRIKTNGYLKRKDIKEVKTMQVLQQIANENIGIEITGQEPKKCVFSEIASIKEDEFDVTIRRIFFFIKGMADNCLKGIKDNKKEVLEDVKYMDINVNKFSLYCHRILSKKGHKDVFLGMELARMLDYLEMIGDEYKDLSFALMNVKKSNKEIKVLFETLNELTSEFYKTYYEYDSRKIRNLYNLCRSLKKNVGEEKNSDLGKVLFHINMIIELIRNAAQRIIEINLRKDKSYH